MASRIAAKIPCGFSRRSICCLPPQFVIAKAGRLGQKAANRSVRHLLGSSRRRLGRGPPPIVVRRTASTAPACESPLIPCPSPDGFRRGVRRDSLRARPSSAAVLRFAIECQRVHLRQVHQPQGDPRSAPQRNVCHSGEKTVRDNRRPAAAPRSDRPASPPAAAFPRGRQRQGLFRVGRALHDNDVRLQLVQRHARLRAQPGP